MSSKTKKDNKTNGAKMTSYALSTSTMQESAIPSLEELYSENGLDELNMNYMQIQKEKHSVLKELGLKREEMKKYEQKLKNYKYVEEISDIRIGRFVRWINLSNPENITLNNGAIVVDVKLIGDKVAVICKTFSGGLFNIKMDEVIIFEKLSNQEIIVFEALNSI